MGSRTGNRGPCRERRPQRQKRNGQRAIPDHTRQLIGCHRHAHAAAGRCGTPRWGTHHGRARGARLLSAGMQGRPTRQWPRIRRGATHPPRPHGVGAPRTALPPRRARPLPTALLLRDDPARRIAVSIPRPRIPPPTLSHRARHEQSNDLPPLTPTPCLSSRPAPPAPLSHPPATPPPPTPPPPPSPPLPPTQNAPGPWPSRPTARPCRPPLARPRVLQGHRVALGQRPRRGRGVHRRRRDHHLHRPACRARAGPLPRGAQLQDARLGAVALPVAADKEGAAHGGGVGGEVAAGSGKKAGKGGAERERGGRKEKRAGEAEREAWWSKRGHGKVRVDNGGGGHARTRWHRNGPLPTDGLGGQSGLW